MASSSVAYDSSLRRCSSMCAASDGENDEKIDVERRQHRISETVCDMSSMEELVKCSIHLGIMEDPRRLQCQHAFCCDCLIMLLKANGQLLCPICRWTEECTDVLSLPKALIEKQLIQVIMEGRLTECIRTPVNEASVSKESKEELVKHLLMELNETSSQIFKFDNPSEIIPDITASNDDHRRSLMTPVSSICSSTYDMMDIETVREKMLKYSCYKDVKTNFIQRICKNHQLKRSFPTITEYSTFDVHITKDHSKSYEIVFVDSNSNQFCVYSETELRSFFIRLDGVIFKPAYIRILHDDLFVTGNINYNTNTRRVLLQCNMYGKLIRKTDVCPLYNLDSGVTMISGFDVDEKNEKFYICIPEDHRIKVFNTSLIECQHGYDFDDHLPEFVTLYQAHKQIWVSCPQSRRILIADVETGAFMMFRTDQINDAIPKMIYRTDDDRVVFLDSRSNRFIWIKRRGDYILTQKLHFRSLRSDSTVNAFQVLPSSLIVVGTMDEFLVFQPVKSKSKVGHNVCLLL